MADAMTDAAAELQAIRDSIDIGWTLFAAALVFWMQAGFTLLESGFVQAKNTQSILMKNILDCGASAIGWFLCGYGLAFGKDNWDEVNGGGFYGTDKYLILHDDLKKSESGREYADFFFQWTFSATAATIVSGALAERCKLEGYMIISFILSFFLYPCVVHWTWAGGWLAKKGYSDFAGSGIVHMFGGCVAIVGATILGPREGTFTEVKKSNSTISARNANQKKHPIWGYYHLHHHEHNTHKHHPSSLMNICLGTFILWFGWFGFNGGSTLGLTGGGAFTAAQCCVTTMLSAGAGGLTCFMLASKKEHKYDVGAFANGILGGLVGITASCNAVDLHIAILIGMISGFIVYAAAIVLLYFEIDDAVGAFPVHGACGMWGVLANGLFNLETGWWSTSTPFNDSIGPQILGVTCIALWAVGTTAPIFLALRAIGLLRVTKEEELEGLDQEFADGPEAANYDTQVEVANLEHEEAIKDYKIEMKLSMDNKLGVLTLTESK